MDPMDPMDKTSKMIAASKAMPLTVILGMGDSWFAARSARSRRRALPNGIVHS
jgi:hypothetical protein